MKLSCLERNEEMAKVALDQFRDATLNTAKNADVDVNNKGLGLSFVADRIEVVRCVEDDILVRIKLNKDQARRDQDSGLTLSRRVVT